MLTVLAGVDPLNNFEDLFCHLETIGIGKLPTTISASKLHMQLPYLASCSLFLDKESWIGIVPTFSFDKSMYYIENYGATEKLNPNLK